MWINEVICMNNHVVLIDAASKFETQQVFDGVPLILKMHLGVHSIGSLRHKCDRQVFHQPTKSFFDKPTCLQSESGVRIGV